MKTFKKFFALFFALTLTLGFSTTAFAAEIETPIPENATRHTVELELLPGEAVTNHGEEGIAPCVWGQYPNYEMTAGMVTYIPIEIPDRYMAFEASALGADGSVVNGPFTVHLLLDDASTAIAGISNIADGTIEKRDWIQCDYTDYRFKICNNTASTIKVTLTYYSWA